MLVRKVTGHCEPHYLLRSSQESIGQKWNREFPDSWRLLFSPEKIFQNIFFSVLFQKVPSAQFLWEFLGFCRDMVELFFLLFLLDSWGDHYTLLKFLASITHRRGSMFQKSGELEYVSIFLNLHINTLIAATSDRYLDICREISRIFFVLSFVGKRS